MRKFSRKSLFCCLAISGCLFTGVQAISFAQSNPGLTIFSGVDRKDQLSYYLDFGGEPNQLDRYRLRIPGKKMTQGAAKFIIKYPDYFDGTFDTDAVEIRIKDQSVPVREVNWDKENQILEIIPETPIKEANKVEIVLSNVRNPYFGGTFYFNCDVLAANDVPIRVYVGTWILSIGR